MFVTLLGMHSKINSKINSQTKDPNADTEVTWAGHSHGRGTHMGETGWFILNFLC